MFPAFPSQIQGIQGTIVGILVVMAGVVKGRRPSGIILQAPGQEMMPLPRRVLNGKVEDPGVGVFGVTMAWLYHIKMVTVGWFMMVYDGL
jgi:hypothetical protein